jgi:hypothetical protein
MIERVLGKQSSSLKEEEVKSSIDSLSKTESDEHKED